MPYLLLFKAISSKIAQKDMDLITAYYQQLRVCSSKPIQVLAFILPICHFFLPNLCDLGRRRRYLERDSRRRYLERDSRRSWGWLLEMIIFWKTPLQLFNACHTLLWKWNKSHVAIKDGDRKNVWTFLCCLTL